MAHRDAIVTVKDTPVTDRHGEHMMTCTTVTVARAGAHMGVGLRAVPEESALGDQPFLLTLTDLGANDVGQSGMARELVLRLSPAGFLCLTDALSALRRHMAHSVAWRRELPD